MSKLFKYPALPQPCTPMLPGLTYSEGQLKGYAGQMLTDYIDDLTPDEVAEAVKYIKSKRPVEEPFDLERAKAGAQLATRDGRKARFLAYVPEAQEGSRVVVFVDGNTTPTIYTDDGRFLGWSNVPAVDDELVIVVPQPQAAAPITYWAAMANPGRQVSDPVGTLYYQREHAAARGVPFGSVKKVQIC